MAEMLLGHVVADPELEEAARSFGLAASAPSGMRTGAWSRRSPACSLPSRCSSRSRCSIRRQLRRHTDVSGAIDRTAQCGTARRRICRVSAWARRGVPGVVRSWSGRGRDVHRSGRRCAGRSIGERSDRRGGAGRVRDGDLTEDRRHEPELYRFGEEAAACSAGFADAAFPKRSRRGAGIGRRRPAEASGPRVRDRPERLTGKKAAGALAAGLLLMSRKGRRCSVPMIGRTDPDTGDESRLFLPKSRKRPGIHATFSASTRISSVSRALSAENSGVVLIV